MNDKPNSIATVEFHLCGNLGIITKQVGIGDDGRGTTGKVDTLVSDCSVFIIVKCGSGMNNLSFAVDPRREPKRTVDCGFSKPIPSSPDWESFGDSMDKIHLDLSPLEISGAELSSASPYDQLNRETEARSFLSGAQVHTRAQEVLYDLFLGVLPPDNTVLQNLQNGQSLESQIALVVGGDQFFAASGNDNSTFVVKAYRGLVDRDPTQWEVDAAVSDLNGYWLWVEQECEPQPCTVDGICMPEPGENSCGYWEWYQITREEFIWGLLTTHEFHQVTAGFMYGVQLRRIGTPAEIEELAYHMDAFGLKEGAVRLLGSQEFFEKSTNPW